MRNRGIALATGSILLNWDDDDLHAANYIERMVAPLVGGHCHIAMTHHRHFGVLNATSFSMLRSDFAVPMLTSLVVRRAVAEEAPYPNVSLGEDLTFVNALLARCVPICNVRLPSPASALPLLAPSSTSPSHPPPRGSRSPPLAPALAGARCCRLDRVHPPRVQHVGMGRRRLPDGLPAASGGELPYLAHARAAR